jgi:subtilisin family serine protease
LNYNTLAGSVGAQSDSGGGVISVGAINASDPGTDTIASYSSRGPTGDGRIKPDITAIDGVNVTGAGGFPDPFFGTSAAAPHVAGLAALLLQFRPDLQTGESGDDPATDRTTLRNASLNGGVDLGAAGTDNVFGFGRADGSSSAAQLFATPAFDAFSAFSVPARGDSVARWVVLHRLECDRHPHCGTLLGRRRYCDRYC